MLRANAGERRSVAAARLDIDPEEEPFVSVGCRRRVRHVTLEEEHTESEPIADDVRRRVEVLRPGRAVGDRQRVPGDLLAFEQASTDSPSVRTRSTTTTAVYSIGSFLVLDGQRGGTGSPGLTAVVYPQR